MVDESVTGAEPGVESQHRPFQAVGPQAGHVLSLSLSFLLSKMGTVMPSWGMGTQLRGLNKLTMASTWQEALYTEDAEKSVV